MSPAVDRGLVFGAFLNRPPCNAATGDGRVVALAEKTGKVRWSKMIGPSESSPLVRGGRVYVGDWNGVVWCFAESTGRLLWSFQSDGKVKDALAFAAARSTSGPTARRSMPSTPTRASSSGRRSPSRACSAPATSTRRPPSPTTACTSARPTARCTRSARRPATCAGRSRPGGYVYSSPAVWDERVYAGSYSGRLYSFDAATGAVDWSFQANGPISGSPTVVAGIVYFATLCRATYALERDDRPRGLVVPGRQVHPGRRRAGPPLPDRLRADLRARPRREAPPRPRCRPRRASGEEARCGARAAASH